MRISDLTEDQTYSIAALAGAALGVLLITVLLFAPSATAANYEQVPSPGFGGGGSYIARGMAVNNTGAGGVPAGTVYEAAEFSGGGSPGRLLEYSGKGELISQHLIGSLVAPAYKPIGVAVNQTTGDVYVLYTGGAGIQVFHPDGSGPFEAFGERAAGTESIAASPSKLHANGSTSRGIAVDDAGKVYVADLGNPVAAEISEGGQLSRVMVFEPHGPEVDKNYAYTGRANDIAASRTNDAVNYAPVHLALDSHGHIYTASEFGLYEFALSSPGSPICEGEFASGGILSMTVDPESGELFFITTKSGAKGHQLVCDGASHQFQPAGEFALTPPPTSPVPIEGLAFSPLFSFEPLRPPGTIYAASSTGVGYILVQPESHLPEVESEFVSQVTSTTAGLNAQINPKGTPTDYAFEYLTEAAYQANEPDERQSVTVNATAGTFVLGFKGQQTGGIGKGNLTEGSEVIESLVTAEGSGTLSAATGAGTLTADSNTVKSVSTGTGAFAIGQVITGAGVREGTTISAVTPTTLTLSTPASASGAGVSLKAGSTVVTGVSTASGQFIGGQPIVGSGIPASTTVVSATPTTVTLSKPAEANAAGVALSSAGPLPFAVGQTISGPGIPAGATIIAAESGALTLSQAATETNTAAALSAGLPFNIQASQLRSVLDGLLSIGGAGGSVEVSGGPGDGTGSSPYDVTFGGALENTDLPQLTVVSSALSGGSPSATIATVHPGGGGFSGAQEAPVGGAPLGSGQESLPASATVAGLTPATGYRYRVVVTSQVGKVPGTPEVFRTFPVEVPGPRDGRAYELVSPAQKHGGEVFPANPGVASCGGECKPGVFLTHFTMQSSPDGEAVAYEGAPFSADEGAIQENEYLSKRTGEGWKTSALSPALQASGNGNRYGGFSSDLTGGVIAQAGPPLSPEAPDEYNNLYAQATSTPAVLEPLLRVAPLGGPPVEKFELTYVGASADMSRVFFEANYALNTSSGVPAVDGGASKMNLYEWTGGQLHLVNVNPDLTTVPGAAFGTAKPKEGTALADLSHAISNDGSRVFWTSESGEVFVRVNSSETEKIEAPGKFLTASADGSKVLLDQGCLYDLQTEACEDLTKDRGGTPRGGFVGILGASEDLSRVYFIDTEPLTEPFEPNENPKGPEHAEEGKFNLYAWSPGSIKFVAVLDAGDAPTLAGHLGAWSASPTQRTAEASPDGEWLTFFTKAQVTGFDNTGPCESDHAGGFVNGRCNEVFLYNHATAKLICASCSPSGARPLGPSHLTVIVEGVEGSVPQPRYLTDAGRLYFDSQDSLSPFDTNGGGPAGRAVEDVYQYQPDGIGTCTAAAGCVSLISQGGGGADSNFLAMDSSGKNVFFTTQDRLVPADRDESVDLYDAREGGGFPPGGSSGECRGEACQPPVPQPSEQVPASPNVEGPGNVPPPKACKKGQVRKNGRCVKKPKHKKQKQHRKSSKNKRGGSK